MNTTLHTESLPVFLCTLWLYNDYYYDDDNYDPQWIHSCDRLIAARSRQRAEVLFLETLKREEVYLPDADCHQIEVSDFTAQWPKYYSADEFNAELITDTESADNASTESIPNKTECITLDVVQRVTQYVNSVTSSCQQNCLGYADLYVSG